MSKFYTYAELTDRFPTMEAVTLARDRVHGFISDLRRGDVAVMYGSSVWSLRRNIPHQHSRRSDVDVAISRTGIEVADKIEAIETFCANISNATGVPVEVKQVTRNEFYHGLINPSTLDHFKLLKCKFPRGPYDDFHSAVKLDTLDRDLDFATYSMNMWGDISSKSGHTIWRMCDLLRPEIRELLSRIENLPIHLIRKALGREGMLPVPDTKQNVVKAFDAVHFSWPFKQAGGKYVERMLQGSLEYETLINGVQGGLAKEAYYSALCDLAVDMQETSMQLLGTHPLSLDEISKFLRMERIPEGNPVIILEHWHSQRGSVHTDRLTRPFCGTYDGLHFQRGHSSVGEPLFESHPNLQWILDPLVPEHGWFHCKPSKSHGRSSSNNSRIYSIKPCSEQLFQEVQKEINWRLPFETRHKNMDSLYARFLVEALDSRYNQIPHALRR